MEVLLVGSDLHEGVHGWQICMCAYWVLHAVGRKKLVHGCRLVLLVPGHKVSCPVPIGYCVS